MNNFVHVYYQFVGSAHWWCHCFNALKHSQHACTHVQRFAAFPQTANDKANECIRDMTGPWLSEVRTLESDKHCPYFEQWEQPPPEARVVFKRSDAVVVSKRQ